MVRNIDTLRGCSSAVNESAWRAALVALVGAVGLSGCLAGDTATDAPVESLPAPERLGFLNGTYAWHADASSPWNELFIGALTLASQPIAHPCLLDDRPYFANLNLTANGLPGPVVEGTRELAVLLEWDFEDYAEDTLLVAFRPNGTRAYHISDPIANGQEARIPVEPAWWGSGRHPSITWDLWLCLAEDGTDATQSGYQPRAFAGSVQVAIDLIVEPAVDAAGLAAA